MTPLFRPPAPEPPDAPLGFWERLRVVRTNALQVWSRDAYEKEIIVAPMLGKAMILYWSWDSNKSMPRFDRMGKLIN